MASDFLEKLKKAVDTGEFNSEAAKKIIEIDELANEKMKGTSGIVQDSNIEKSINDRLDKAGVKTVTEEEAAIINSEPNKKMLEIKEKDLALQQIKTLKEIDELVMLSVYDMREFIQTVVETFDNTKPANVELFSEIERVKTRYGSIINS
jgi:hypothetical protein